METGINEIMRNSGTLTIVYLIENDVDKIYLLQYRMGRVLWRSELVHR